MANVLSNPYRRAVVGTMAVLGLALVLPLAFAGGGEEEPLRDESAKADVAPPGGEERRARRQADEGLELRLYDIRPLAATFMEWIESHPEDGGLFTGRQLVEPFPFDGGAGFEPSADDTIADLIDIVQTSVGRFDDWEVGGGKSHLRYFKEHLLVTTTSANHEELSHLLERLSALWDRTVAVDALLLTIEPAKLDALRRRLADGGLTFSTEAAEAFHHAAVNGEHGIELLATTRTLIPSGQSRIVRIEAEDDVLDGEEVHTEHGFAWFAIEPVIHTGRDGIALRAAVAQRQTRPGPTEAPHDGPRTLREVKQAGIGLAAPIPDGGAVIAAFARMDGSDEQNITPRETVLYIRATVQTDRRTPGVEPPAPAPAPEDAGR